jgi:hypothetical protein
MLQVVAALALVAGVTQQGQRPQQGQGIKKGSKAQAFKLDLLQEGKSFDLAEHTGKRPVVIVFGSYT